MIMEKVDSQGDQVNFYEITNQAGKGSFGIVYEAKMRPSGRKVAIKKVHQDPKYKNRELDILKILKHPNIVDLLDHYIVADNRGNDILNLVMEWVPETLYAVTSSSRNDKGYLPMIYVKLFTWQLCRAVGYLHTCGFGHRDIKPQNLLVDKELGILKLCDFGSAKRLIPPEKSVAYICSRYYRAPELILGLDNYGCYVDVWSIGCVFGEILRNKALFVGETSIDQMQEIINILGSPTPADVAAMNPKCKVKFPITRERNLRDLFDSLRVPDSAVDLLDKLLKYQPQERLHPLEVLAHPFFEEILDPLTVLNRKNIHLDYILKFTDKELNCMSGNTRNLVLQKRRLFQKYLSNGIASEA
eukprot:GHVP01047183.1.p1 GENE.GHVP01047183.1~~GHVP01047183.1.p1  ORF type:complete len:358 (-),score=48.84 GHVP01047183.1:2063-3136(-)